MTVNGKSIHQFTALATSGPAEYRVTAYEQAFGDGTPIAVAKAEVLKQLPSDTHVQSFFVSHQGGSCALWNLKSTTLGHLLAKTPKAVPKTQGAVGVDFSADNSSDEPEYNRNNVSHASVGIAPLPPGTRC